MVHRALNMHAMPGRGIVFLENEDDYDQSRHEFTHH